MLNLEKAVGITLLYAKMKFFDRPERNSLLSNDYFLER